MKQRCIALISIVLCECCSPNPDNQSFTHEHQILQCTCLKKLVFHFDALLQKSIFCPKIQLIKIWIFRVTCFLQIMVT